jgi:hypothetical protein
MTPTQCLHPLRRRQSHSNAQIDRLAARTAGYSRSYLVYVHAMCKSSPRQQPLAHATVAVATQRGRARCASEVQPRLYLADYSSATDPALLATLRVSHVVCCMEDAPELRTGLQRLHVPVSDVPSADLGVWFARTNAWIADALADAANVVLVHCLMVRVSPLSSSSPTDVSIGHEVRLWSVPALDAELTPHQAGAQPSCAPT